MSDHHIGPMGWGEERLTFTEKQRIELDRYETLAADMPVCYRARPAQQFNEELLAKWNAFQDANERSSGSCDLTLMEQFVLGKKYRWLPQDIGSCVISNTFRAWVRRCLFEVALRGDAEEYLGKYEYGTKSISFFAPWSYGAGRKRGNMRGGDGSYCQVQIESFMKDGVVPCSSPKLRELLQRLNADTERDYPEVRSTSLYRAFGDWKYHGDLLPYADYRLLESTTLKSADDFLAASKAYKPALQCSMIAITAKGKHKDGFTIHVQDTRNQWAHNMSLQGYRVASDGNIFARLSNESWLQANDPDDEKYKYNVPIEELSKWFNRGLLTSMTIGEIDLPDSRPQTL